jgi:hypothetical protein
VPVGPSGESTASSSPTPRSRTGSRPGGEKAERRIDPDHLDWALSDFSGPIAADELYDGPFCILSIVDNRTFKRLIYQVLDHDPTHKDIEAFFGRFHAALKTRGLVLKGITTDGSALYPEPIATVFGEVPHQLCTFHVLKEVTKAVLGAVAKLRKSLAADAPKLGRGRPGSKAARRAARRKSGRSPVSLRPWYSDQYAYRYTRQWLPIGTSEPGPGRPPTSRGVIPDSRGCRHRRMAFRTSRPLGALHLGNPQPPPNFANPQPPGNSDGASVPPNHAPTAASR